MNKIIILIQSIMQYINLKKIYAQNISAKPVL